jgi:hypothetical protein
MQTKRKTHEKRQNNITLQKMWLNSALALATKKPDCLTVYLKVHKHESFCYTKIVFAGIYICKFF